MGRNVVVTGGGTGIGRAVAASFAADGDTVLILGRRAALLEDTAADLGGGVRPVTCDVANPAEVELLRDRLPETVEVLVHCAGGNTDLGRSAAADLRALAVSWQANLTANLISAVLMVAVVRDRLAAGGVVITVGSIAADKGAGGYGAAKAGLGSWNVGLAAELGPRGITANVVAPGYIAGTEFFRDTLTDQRRDALVAATLTGRAGEVDDVVGAVRFLASPAARHITGQVLEVNGGAHTRR